MIEAYIDVVAGAGEWYGLDATLTDNVLHITEGRIGRAENPIEIMDGVVHGGWYVEPIEIELSPKDTHVDILRRIGTDDLVFFIREGKNQPYNAHEYEMVLRYLWKDNDVWHIALPRWIDEG